MVRIISLVTLLLLLGCQAGQPAAPTSPATALAEADAPPTAVAQSTPTPPPTDTIVPTNTHTSAPTGTPTPTYTPMLTDTPEPTDTPSPTPPPPGTTSRVSVASDGTQANNSSFNASISADGRYVAFQSQASNLVPVDTNGTDDVFVHDRETGQTSRVSLSSDGTEGNDASGFPSISADGRYIAFGSFASNLVPNDTNGAYDVFVHDRETGQTSRVSVASDGTQEEGISWPWAPSISADARHVAFMSGAVNLVPDDTNDNWDIFVHDRQTGQTSRVSVASDGTQGNNESRLPAISADGRYVAFSSSASNLVPGTFEGTNDVFVHDRETGQTSLISISFNGIQGMVSAQSVSISADGRYVTYASRTSGLIPGDTNNDFDVFVFDRETWETSRVSVASDGMQGNGGSLSAFISADGRYVLFQSGASNLVPGDSNGLEDVFVHDRVTGQTSRISVASDGTQGNSPSSHPSISANGRYVVFASDASNLVPNDTNEATDIFVHYRGE